MIVPFQKWLHYPLLCEWWKAWDWTPMPSEALPPTGAVCNVEGQPVAVGFLYKTDSLYAVLEFILTDKNYDRLKRSAAIDAVISHLCDEAARAGHKLVFISTPHKSLIGRLVKTHGFLELDTGCSNLLKRV